MPGERRTLIVVITTSAMMVIEIATGIAFGSMALLADGLHMASHAVALIIAYFAYIYARRHARDERFSFGTGKVNSLAGFTGAVLLAVFALGMAWESVNRFLNPVAIEFTQAIVVAIVGLIVNALCAVVLGHHDGGHHHQGAESLDESGEHPEQTQRRLAAHPHDHNHHDDHNLRSAYLHVVADAFTSVLAIFALLAGKYADAVWLDPAMGIVGAVLVARWSVGLIRTTAQVLLDWQAPNDLCGVMQCALSADGDTEVVDLHVWVIGPGRYAAAMSIVSAAARQPDEYKERLMQVCPGLVHVTIEVNAAPKAGE